MSRTAVATCNLAPEQWRQLWATQAQTYQRVIVTEYTLNTVYSQVYVKLPIPCLETQVLINHFGFGYHEPMLLGNGGVY